MEAFNVVDKNINRTSFVYQGIIKQMPANFSSSTGLWSVNNLKYSKDTNLGVKHT